MTDLTPTTLQDFLQSNRFVIVHFWASWNGYDIIVKNMLASLPDQLPKVIAIGRIDVDPAEHHGLCKQHNVLNVPFLALYRDGSLIETITGVHDSMAIVGHLERLVA